MIYEIEIGGRAAAVSVQPDGEGYRVSIDGGPVRWVAASQIGAAEWRIADLGEGSDGAGESDGTGESDGGAAALRGSRTVAVHVDREVLSAQVAGHGLVGSIVDPRDRGLDALQGSADGDIRTPMPGAVARVLVSVGDAVAPGQILVVVEAMKMENEFKAPIAGRVAEVAVAAGQTVDANALLVVVEGEDA